MTLVYKRRAQITILNFMFGNFSFDNQQGELGCSLVTVDFVSDSYSLKSDWQRWQVCTQLLFQK